MDAGVYCKTLLRMCKSHPVCGGCPLKSKDGCIAVMLGDMEKAVPIVEQWAKDHPVKTRQSEFLKMFPNANLKDITRLLPCSIDSNIKPLRCAKYGYLSITCRCDRCRDDYWNEEVSE